VPAVFAMQEQRQQCMAGAAELQAQIAEKENRKRMERQESLRQSQDLLAQRMARPSGLVRQCHLHVHCLTYVCTGRC